MDIKAKMKNLLKDGIPVPANFTDDDILCEDCYDSHYRTYRTARQEATQGSKGRGKKIGIIIGSIIIGIIIIVAIAEYASLPYSYEAKPDEILGITNFLVLKEGSFYTARFILVDRENVYVTSNANVKFAVKTEDKMLYSDEFNIRASDFKPYKFVFTGQPFVAYVWNIEGDKIQYDDLDFPEATLTVTLPNNKSFTAKTTVFG